MSSFVQVSPVIYGTFGGGCGKYPPSTGTAAAAADCYYAAGRGQTGTTFYHHGVGVEPSRRCYTPGGDYGTAAYGQQRAAGPYGAGRYEPQQPQQQQQPHQQMYVSEYRPHQRVYGGGYDQAPPPTGSEALVYAGDELVRPAGNSPSAGVVPVSSPAAVTAVSAGPCSRYSPPSVAAAAAAVPQRGDQSMTQAPVIYPWMKMVHSLSGE